MKGNFHVRFLGGKAPVRELEGKALPDYSGTDSYQVSLTFKVPIFDTAFVIFVRKVQDNRAVAEQLNVFELLALYKMAMRDCEGLDEKIL